MSLQTLKQRALANAEVRTEYEKLETEFNLIDQLLTMRNKAGLTNPSWSTLLKYAHACGFELTLKSQKVH